jgi:putative oxidoreductase
MIDLSFLQHGAGLHDEALALVRIGVGSFFTCSGYNKVFVPSRHATIRDTLVRDKVPAVKFNEWWVPLWEFTGGVCLLAGFNTAFVSGVLIIVCLVACACEAPSRVNAYKPINRPDRLADWLYLPEVLYIFLLAVTALSGGGRWSVDAFLRG